MITVTLYHRDNCPKCDEILADLSALQAVTPHRVVRVNVESDRGLREKFGENFPVIEVGPYRLKSPFDRKELQVMLSAAQDRVGQLEQVDKAAYQRSVQAGRTLSFGDKLSYFLSNHYLLLINLIVFIYVGLPFLAPTLMKLNAPIPASILYRIYSPLCHQLTFRSWFLFGEQAFYPRELSSVDGVVTYESLGISDNLDLAAARNFLGNETVGYKVALCQRDVAIYGSMLLFGLIFIFARGRIKTIPWYLWLLLGLVPIGIDGVSQLPSVASGLPDWVPMRESSPFLRTLTGGMFGWMTAWYLYPMLDETMSETRRIVKRKMAVLQQAKNTETA